MEGQGMSRISVRSFSAVEPASWGGKANQTLHLIFWWLLFLFVSDIAVSGSHRGLSMQWEYFRTCIRLTLRDSTDPWQV